MKRHEETKERAKKRSEERKEREDRGRREEEGGARKEGDGRRLLTTRTSHLGCGKLSDILYLRRPERVKTTK